MKLHLSKYISIMANWAFRVAARGTPYHRPSSRKRNVRSSELPEQPRCGYRSAISTPAPARSACSAAIKVSRSRSSRARVRGSSPANASGRMPENGAGAARSTAAPASVRCSPMRAAVDRVLHRQRQFAFEQQLDEVAGGGLVHVHRAAEFADPDAWPGLDHAQCPHLGAADAGSRLDLAKMHLDGIEDNAELTQHAARRVAAGILRGNIVIWMHPGMITEDVPSPQHAAHGARRHEDQRSHRRRLAQRVVRLAPVVVARGGGERGGAGRPDRGRIQLGRRACRRAVRPGARRMLVAALAVDPAVRRRHRLGDTPLRAGCGRFRHPASDGGARFGRGAGAARPVRVLAPVGGQGGADHLGLAGRPVAGARRPVGADCRRRDAGDPPLPAQAQRASARMACWWPAARPASPPLSTRRWPASCSPSKNCRARRNSATAA